MKRPTPVFWMSLGLVSLTLSILLMSDLAVNLVPDEAAHDFHYRQKYSEALGVQYSLLAKNGDSRGIQEAFELLVERNEDIESVALILGNGELFAQAGPHLEMWEQPEGDTSTPENIQVPIYHDADRWGTVQVRFQEKLDQGWQGFFENSWVQFLALVVCSGFLGYFLYMKRMLRQLDPSSVVPMRVKAAFDVLTEGVVLLDNDERIVLANRAFGEIVKVDSADLLSKKLEIFHWSSPDPTNPLLHFPWVTARQDKCMELDFPLMLKKDDGVKVKFRVNCSPILDERQGIRGMLVSFDDVTQLQTTIQALEDSKAELEKLAMRDPLTGCFNRRALFEAFEDQWSIGQSPEGKLGCIMTDIDHFKSFNDRYGHAVGDKVIQGVAKILSNTIRPTDIIGRYGGEEFCLILPGQGPEGTALAAERIRKEIEELASQMVRTTSGQKITMSFGVSCIDWGASDPLELIDQADKALYAAKQAGRNTVGEWTDDGPRTGKFAQWEQEAEPALTGMCTG